MRRCLKQSHRWFDFLLLLYFNSFLLLLYFSDILFFLFSLLSPIFSTLFTFFLSLDFFLLHERSPDIFSSYFAHSSYLFPSLSNPTSLLIFYFLFSIFYFLFYLIQCFASTSNFVILPFIHPSSCISIKWLKFILILFLCINEINRKKSNKFLLTFHDNFPSDLMWQNLSIRNIIKSIENFWPVKMRKIRKPLVMVRTF